uniref:Copper transport protein n=1 Tax=Syphacia muris TaxID=451379 RepID=A0A0N5AW77_9BILA
MRKFCKFKRELNQQFGDYYQIYNVPPGNYGEFLGPDGFPVHYRRSMALLCFCQTTAEAFIIFCVFSFNLWILLAVICGETLGYWLLIGEPVINPVITE